MTYMTYMMYCSSFIHASSIDRIVRIHIHCFWHILVIVTPGEIIGQNIRMKEGYF